MPLTAAAVRTRSHPFSKVRLGPSACQKAISNSRPGARPRTSRVMIRRSAMESIIRRSVPPWAFNNRPMQLLSLSATQQARLIRQREISSLELVQAHLDQIRRVNPAIHAAIEVFADRAVAEARTADETPAGGPLHGVPFSVKDSIELSGSVPTAGPPRPPLPPPSLQDPKPVAPPPPALPPP